MEPVNIIIIDDHSLVREGIKQLLELDGDIKVKGKLVTEKKELS